MPTFILKAVANQLPKLIARAETGEEILIARGTKLVARLVPIGKRGRKLGRLEGLGKVGPEFFDPLPEDELKLWEGR